jgi:GNAT superfamily N-acetyltransferase
MQLDHIEIFEVSEKDNLRDYIHLPAKIHKNHTNWVPPIYMDEWLFFNPKKNLAFGHSTTILLLARRGSKVVGRIMGIINHQYNEKRNVKDARFCFLETFDDIEVAHALIKRVEDWAIDKGSERLIGPLGFSDKDPQGLLIDGFDQPNVIATNCNYPYLVDFVKKAGYEKELDLVVYKVIVPATIPEFYKKIYERVLNSNGGIRVIHLKSKKEIKPYVRPVLTLMNETFRGIYGFAELSVKEMDEFAQRYIMVLDPRFLKVVENDKGEVIAFVLGMPDISEGVKKSRGYMLPFGIINVLSSQKRTKQLNLLLGAIKPEYQNRGISTILGVSLLDEAIKAGFTHIDSHLEMETNLKVRAEMERMGGVVYKKFRIFYKNLVNQ